MLYWIELNKIFSQKRRRKLRRQRVLKVYKISQANPNSKVFDFKDLFNELRVIFAFLKILRSIQYLVWFWIVLITRQFSMFRYILVIKTIYKKSFVENLYLICMFQLQVLKHSPKIQFTSKGHFPNFHFRKCPCAVLSLSCVFPSMGISCTDWKPWIFHLLPF